MGSTQFLKFADVQPGGCFVSVPANVSPLLNTWEAARKDYDASPVRSKAFCTLSKDEQRKVVREYLDRR